MLCLNLLLQNLYTLFQFSLLCIESLYDSLSLLASRVQCGDLLFGPDPLAAQLAYEAGSFAIQGFYTLLQLTVLGIQALDNIAVSHHLIPESR